MAGGIIPARAGFTDGHKAFTDLGMDHPRSRGVYACRPFQRVCAPGSSPLARGLLGRLRRLRQVRRIIPARAGFTPRICAPAQGTEDHPRSRGVYDPVTGMAAVFPWIIPARAGFTSTTSPTRTCASDHPRSRGVYVRWRSLPRRIRGSSPLARGLHHCGAVRVSRERIIPARAGFTGHPTHS